MSKIEKARAYWRSHEDQKAIDILNVDDLATSAEALFVLGDIYNCADKRVGGVSRSVPQARKYWLEAVKYGSMDSAVELGNLYYFGDGVKQNYRKAEEFWLIAANGGDELGMFKLADFYFDYYPEKIPDGIVLFELLTKGTTFARNSYCKLGRIFDRGIGVERDPKKAISWYEAGARLNDGNCLLDLSYLYYKGDGIEKDINKAIELAEKAADTEWLKDIAPIVVEKMRKGTLLN
ncbi:tetratricopeptide repeat protein [Thalassotalea litorea]|uniref:tetratricopeptide repeat protein n=1 Tax=Thalassotalea litorea TaxID=2020715 RepID=UPI0037350DCB